MSKFLTNPLEEFRPPAYVEELNTRTPIKIQEEKELDPTVPDKFTSGEDFSGTNKIKHNELECAQALVSLEADVNKENLLGKKPLDLPNVQRELKHANWDIQPFQLESGTSNMEALEGSKLLPVMQENDSHVNKIQELLTSVGAHTGRRSSSKKDTHTHNTEAEVQTASVPIIDEPEFMKINTTYDIREDVLRRVRDASQPVTAKEVQSTMIDKMIHQEGYWRKCGSKILCLDGGGIRGLIQLSVLQEIERRTKRKIVDLFDWIVGTSTGGIIALALSYGTPEHGRKTLCQLRDMYWSMKDSVFGEAQCRFLGFLAKGNTQILQEMLQNCFGKYTTLSDTTCPKVLIPAVYKKYMNLELHFFNNCFDDAYSKELVWKVARYTSAAPFYFKEFENYIDGGMLANNPSEAALTVIQDFYHKKGEKIPISMVVSLGTGINPAKPLGEIDIRSNLFNRNAYFDLMDVMEAAADHKQTDHFNCASRCREQGIHYFRLDPELKEKVASDSHNSQALHKMIGITRQYLNSKKDDLDRLVQMLMESE